MMPGAIPVVCRLNRISPSCLEAPMQTADPTNRRTTFLRVAVAAALAAALSPAAALAGDGPKLSDGKADRKKAPGPVAVRFVDDSTMKVTFLDERIELETPHGKLL